MKFLPMIGLIGLAFCDPHNDIQGPGNFVRHGKDNHIRGAHNKVGGCKNKIKGQLNDIQGDQNNIQGNQNIIQGDRNLVIGSGNLIMGGGNIVRNSQLKEQLNNIQINAQFAGKFGKIQQNIQNLQSLAKNFENQFVKNIEGKISEKIKNDLQARLKGRQGFAGNQGFHNSIFQKLQHIMKSRN